MLSPDELNHAPDALAELWNECETDILKDMARRISTYDYFIPAAQHQKQKLEAAGLMENEIRSRLSKLTGRTESELTELFTSAGEKTIQTDTEIYKSADIYRADKIDNESLNDVLRSGLVQTHGLFKNLTQTTANTATRQFENALDRAWMQVSSGAFDYNTAVRFAVKDLSKAGIQTIQYGSGAVTSVEAAVRRAVVTGLNQTSLKLQDELADEVGCDLVETTAHGGARPEHAVWQGRVFSRSGRSEKYPKFSTATGYGTGDGLGGWNCRHSYYPYVEGAARAYTDAQLKDYEARKYEYNGRQMTEYEASQQQRKIERNVRRWKRENVAMKAAGMDTTESAVKIRQWEEAYQDFNRKTGLKSQAERMQIGGYSRSEANKAAAEAREYYEYWSKSTGVNDAIKTLAKYYDVKYNDTPRYTLLQKYVSDVTSGWVTPLIGFLNYETVYNRIETELVGKKTINGVQITGQSKHFIQRVIGTMVDPKKIKDNLRVEHRSGIEIDDVVDAVINGNPGKLQGSEGGVSQVFKNKKCMVTVNIDTGILIQCNSNKGAY